MKELKQIAVIVLGAAVLSIAGAIIDVQVLKANVSSISDAIEEIRADVKEIKKAVLRK